MPPHIFLYSLPLGNTKLNTGGPPKMRKLQMFSILSLDPSLPLKHNQTQHVTFQMQLIGMNGQIK